MSASTGRMPERLTVGCMTGTSIDGLDAALVRVRGPGLGMQGEFIRGVSRPLGDLGPRLRALAEQRPMAAGEIARLSREFALLHADVVREVMQGEGVRLGKPDDSRLDAPTFVAVHGQTAFHAPPVSWQMFNGAVLARELGAPVVFDLRAADLAAGGQGAPITPLADWILFRSERRTAVVNLGGFCNATVLPAHGPHADPSAQIAEIEGFDVCACNHVLDGVARELLGKPYDEGGMEAASGVAESNAAGELERILVAQAGAGRSLGTGDETEAWIGRWRTRAKGADLAASACAAVGATLARRIKGVERVIIAGGGARNAALVKSIGAACGARVETTEAEGVPVEFREAAEMAILGALCQDRVPITLARVTGVKDPPIAGVWAGV
jgi:anhydro-N-acetylmuramic acid kinase